MSLFDSLLAQAVDAERQRLVEQHPECQSFIRNAKKKQHAAHRIWAALAEDSSTPEPAAIIDDVFIRPPC